MQTHVSTEGYMDHERWDGAANYQREGEKRQGTLTIHRIQSFRNLVTIEGLGQGKVTFDRNGSFQGCWAMGDQIFDVTGRAEGDRSHWEGQFEIRGMDGRIVVSGSFQANKTHD